MSTTSIKPVTSSDGSNIEQPKRAWAPLDVPISRRRQTFTVLMWYMVIPLSYLLAIFFIRCNGVLFYSFIAYVTWMIFIAQYHVNGGLKSHYFRSLTWWTWFRDYFPIYLHKTVDIPADRAYIFGYHPHGIIGLGAFGNFATEATGFGTKFPGIDLRLLTLTTNFRIPFYHLYLSLLGVCDASRESCSNILSRGSGNSVMLVLGGAKESLDARPGSYDLTLKQRKGFVKVALENNASLVPVIAFGETDLYDQVENPQGSRLRNIQIMLQEKMGFALPLVKGRGVFNYSFGILPQRRPIHVIVGAPIILPSVSYEEINSDLINKYHALYLQALQDLFNEHKPLYAPTAQLRFVDEPSNKPKSQKNSTTLISQADNNTNSNDTSKHNPSESNKVNSNESSESPGQRAGSEGAGSEGLNDNEAQPQVESLSQPGEPPK